MHSRFFIWLSLIVLFPLPPTHAHWHTHETWKITVYYKVVNSSIFSSITRRQLLYDDDGIHPVRVYDGSGSFGSLSFFLFFFFLSFISPFLFTYAREDTLLHLFIYFPIKQRQKRLKTNCCAFWCNQLLKRDNPSPVELLEKSELSKLISLCSLGWHRTRLPELTIKNYRFRKISLQRPIQAPPLPPTISPSILLATLITSVS